VDDVRIPPAGDPFSIENPKKTAPCAGCRQRFPRRNLVTVHEDHHDGLEFFDGDRVCRPCARRNGVGF
jgi:hypothetical protein